MRPTLLLLLALLPGAASATPVLVPPVQGLPISEPGTPAPEPCVEEACPVGA